MKDLNAFELVGIKKGIEVELQEGYKLHEGVEHETFNLFMTYTDMLINPSRFSEEDKEITVSALHKLADFWTNYYLYGELKARIIYLRDEFHSTH